jgi:hypothetical protein
MTTMVLRRGRMTKRGWLLFSAMCVLWGMPYLLIKIAVEELSPAQLVLLRTGFAALLLLPYALWKGQVGPALRHWKPVLAFTALELTSPVVPAGERGDAAVQLADRTAGGRGAAGGGLRRPGGRPR